MDDHPLTREALAAVIEQQQDMVLVGDAFNGVAAIGLFGTHKPDVTVMDLRLPDMAVSKRLAVWKFGVPLMPVHGLTC